MNNSTTALHLRKVGMIAFFILFSLIVLIETITEEGFDLEIFHPGNTTGIPDQVIKAPPGSKVVTHPYNESPQQPKREPCGENGKRSIQELLKEKYRTIPRKISNALKAIDSQNATLSDLMKKLGDEKTLEVFKKAIGNGTDKRNFFNHFNNCFEETIDDLPLGGGVIRKEDEE